MTPVEVVQGQVDAYNDRDLERFVAYYSDDIAVYRMPAAQPILEGKAQFAAFYAAERFNLPALHAQILARIVLGSKVVDHERIVGVRETPMEIVAVYEVIADRIVRVWFFPAE